MKKNEPTKADLIQQLEEKSALLERMTAIIREHEKEQGISYSKDLDRRLAHVLDYYNRCATDSLAQAKAFGDDILVCFRAFVIVAESAGRAETHKEKDARLRGLVDMLELAASKLRDHEMKLSLSAWRFPDVFASDYPTQQYVRRIHELESQLEEYKQNGGNSDATHNQR